MNPFFKLLADLVEERTGLHYADYNLDVFVACATACMAKAGFPSITDYYYHLRYDGASTDAFHALIDELVIGETYFFRELDQLRSLRDDVILPLVAKNERPRIWCAASSTGEEPLSIAMLLADAGVLSRVEIVASDISQKSLTSAKSGQHGVAAFRALPEGVQKRWMETKSDGTITLAPEIRKKIEWHRLNLMDDSAVRGLGTFDAILCRNVFIYFRDETIRRIVTSLSGALRAKGRLFVGASESLLRFGTLLRCEERNGAFSYFRSDP